MLLIVVALVVRDQREGMADMLLLQRARQQAIGWRLRAIKQSRRHLQRNDELREEQFPVIGGL